jgi:Na+-transporting methylmalonyl-CoA/oxaloacetate decarboxylase gamma subunit
MTSIVTALPLLLLAIPVVFAVLFVLVNFARLVIDARRAARFAPPRAIARYSVAPLSRDDEVTHVFTRAYAR